jgi:hypothetical protein
MTRGPAPDVIAENRGHRGLTAGFWGCLLAVLGILFSVGVVFVLVAIVCTLVGLVRGVSAHDAISIATSLLAACLCVVGFASLPLRIRNNTHNKQRQHPHRVRCTGEGANVETCRAIRMCGELLSHAALASFAVKTRARSCLQQTALECAPVSSYAKYTPGRDARSLRRRN